MDKVAIIGCGYVGKAYLKVFPDAVQYDEPLGIGTREQVNECELAIVSVPTPMQEGSDEFKKVDLSIIKEVVGWLETPYILLKSTVPPGTVDKLCGDTGKHICFSPEYVGEGRYQTTPWKYMSPNDPLTHEFQIIGGMPYARERIAQIFTNRLGPEKFYYLIDAIEAEVIKYMENSWGAMKVMFANEFYQLCQEVGASYTRVREGWALDNRVERMHTAVFVDNQGFGGKCYPKDLNGIVSFADEIGVDMALVKTVLRQNKKVSKAIAAHRT